MHLYRIWINGKKPLKNITLCLKWALELERDLACFIPVAICDVVWSLCFDGLVSPIQGDISAQVEVAVKKTYHEYTISAQVEVAVNRTYNEYTRITDI